MSDIAEVPQYPKEGRLTNFLRSTSFTDNEARLPAHAYAVIAAMGILTVGMTAASAARDIAEGVSRLASGERS